MRPNPNPNSMFSHIGGEDNFPRRKIHNFGLPPKSKNPASNVNNNINKSSSHDTNVITGNGTTGTQNSPSSLAGYDRTGITSANNQTQAPSGYAQYQPKNLSKCPETDIAEYLLSLGTHIQDKSTGVFLPKNTHNHVETTKASETDASTTAEALSVSVASDEFSTAAALTEPQHANKPVAESAKVLMDTPVSVPDEQTANNIASAQTVGEDIRTDAVIEQVNELTGSHTIFSEVQMEGIISSDSVAGASHGNGKAETAASSTEADSLPAPATCDVPFTAPEALRVEVAPQTLAERCEADRNLLTLKRQPSVITPPDPNFQAGYVSWSDLVHSRWVEYFIHTPQVKKLIALAVKAALGTSAWGTPIQLVKMLERIRNLEDEQGCYNVVDDKPLGFPHAWLKAGLCAVYPPENGGGLVAENFWIVPEIIVKKNNQMLPAAADLAKTSVSRLNYATNNMAPGPCLTKNKFITRCLEGKRENHVLEFIRCGMPHVTGAPIIDREPPVVELPLLGLLYRECTRHKYFDQYCKGLEHLNLLFAEQSGIQEATALVCFDAVTLGNPDNIMDTLLQMATDTYLTAETEEARQAGKDALIARVHGWLYETFQLGILHTPQQFEKKLYTRMFSHPPVHLHW